MIIGLKLKKSYWEELEKRIRMLEEKSVKVGVFDNTPRGDGFWTNVSLMSYLSGGDMDKGLVPRPVIQIAFSFFPIESSPAKKELEKYFRSINRKKGESHADKVFQGIGEFYSAKTKLLFGKSPPLAANTDYTQRWKESLGYKGNSPLLMTGELRESITYDIRDSKF